MGNVLHLLNQPGTSTAVTGRGAKQMQETAPKPDFPKRMQSFVLQAASMKAVENCHGALWLGMGFQKGSWLPWKMVLDLMLTDFAGGTRDLWLQPGLAAILESGKHWKICHLQRFSSHIWSRVMKWVCFGFPHQNGRPQLQIWGVSSKLQPGFQKGWICSSLFSPLVMGKWLLFWMIPRSFSILQTADSQIRAWHRAGGWKPNIFSKSYVLSA